MKKAIKRSILAALCIIAVVLIAAGGYVGYLFADYSRLEDNLSLDVFDATDAALPVGKEQTIITWNLGFGAYSADYSFFMDGGNESRARSTEAVHENIGGALQKLQSCQADLILLQEIDLDSTRSHHIDQTALIAEGLPQYDRVFAQNYDSSYLFYPFSEPHGASKSGLITLSKAHIQSALRRSLPVETGFMKFFDLDRCYCMSRIPTDNGKTLCLYNLHLSAYSSDGTIAIQQLEMMLSDMADEYNAGNYVIAGGDFNKDLPGNSSKIFGIPAGEFTWAQPLPRELLPEGFIVVDSVNPNSPTPSCRNADVPYTPGESFVLTVDGFIVSDNVEILSTNVEDEGFAFSDHNPVKMTFMLNP